MLIYSLFSMLGIFIGYVVSKKIDMPKPTKAKQFDIYIACLFGIIVGMKLPVWVSYGFNSDLLLSGKSVMGGILGAFISLNIYKYNTNQQSSSFGGRFVIPLAIAVGFGKIGCWFHGCCGGDFLIPPQILESIFQFIMAFGLYIFYKKTNRIDLLFPLYLLGYLIERFFVEFIRIEPEIFLNFTIYQILSIIFIPIISLILYKRKNLI